MGRGRRLPTFVCAVCFLLSGGASARQTHPVSRAPIVVLGRVSTFRTTRTRSILVRLPYPVDFNKDFHARYVGGGRFRGFVLARTGDPVELDGTPYVSDVQPGWCSTKGCRPASNDHVSFPANFGRYLPAGVYRLYQVADGPMTLVLRLDSLRGVVRARPLDAVQSAIRTLPATAVTPGQTLYSAGEFTPLRGGVADFAAVGVWINAGPHVVSGYGECVYEPEMLAGQTLPRHLAFAPNCPTGENMWKDHRPQYTVSDTEDIGKSHVRWSISYAGAEISGSGGWYDSVADVHDAGVVGLWLNFRGGNRLMSGERR